MNYRYFPGQGVCRVLGTQMKDGKEFTKLEVVDNGQIILLPKDVANALGLRNLISKDDAEKLLARLNHAAVPLLAVETWSSRYKRNLETLMNGSPADICQVVMEMRVRKEMGFISAGEKRMLALAEELLMTEIYTALSSGKDGES